MVKKISRRLLTTLVIVSGMVFLLYVLLQGEEYTVLDFPQIDQQHIVSVGFVDDKDDVSTGPAKRIIVPEYKAVDGLSEIKADRQSDCRVIRGWVTLRPGPQAETPAVAFLEMKAICPFDWEDQRTVGYMIDHDIDIVAEKAAGSYLVETKILNKQKKVVQGSRYTETYSFSAGSAGKIHVNMDNQRTGRIDSGEDFSAKNVSAKPFDLLPGSYLMTFQVQIRAQAQQKMDLMTSVALDFIDGKELR